MNIFTNQKGASIIAVIAIMLILAVMGAALVSLVTTGSDVSVNQLQSEQALQIAEGGVEYAIRQLVDTSGGYTGELGKQLGSGTCDITVSVGGPPQTITSTATVGSAKRVVEANVNVSTGVIAVDTQNFSSGNNVNSITWSHTVGAGSNRILIVGVSLRNNTSQMVSSVTYGGIALTSIGAVSNGTNVGVEMWYLVAPAVGVNNIIVTLPPLITARFVGGAVSFTGVNQTTPIDAAFVSATGNSNTPSVSITTVANNAWVIDTAAILQNITLTVGAGQIQQWNRSAGGGSNRVNGAGSTEGPKTPVGAVTMSWNITAGGPQPWAIGAVSLKPGTTGVSVLNQQEKY